MNKMFLKLLVGVLLFTGVFNVSFGAVCDNNIGYWKLETDGTASNGTIGNFGANVHTAGSMPSFTTGIIGNGTSFPGTGSVAMESPSFTGSNEYTVNFWWNPTTNKTADVISKDTVSGTGRVWAFNANGTSNVQILGWNSGSTLYLSGLTAHGMSTGTWYMWTIRWNATTNRLTVYKNASSLISVVTTGNAQTGTAPINVGTQYNSGTFNLASKIDEIGYWSRVLTDAEVTEIYNAGAPTTAQQCPATSAATTPMFWNWDF